MLPEGDSSEQAVRVQLEHGFIVQRSETAGHSLVLFIHGVLGSPEETWGSFPEYIVTDPTLGFCDVGHFHYKTGFFFEDKTVAKIGSIFKGWLEQNLTEYRHIFILAHSLGGLVTRYALHLLHASTTEESSSVWKRIRAVFLIAVPNKGSWVASLAEKIPVFWGNRIVRELKRDSEPVALLGSLNTYHAGERAVSSMNAPRFKVIYGTEDWVVPKASARHVGHAPYAIAIRGDHQAIVKPKSPKYTSVNTIRNELREYGRSVPVREYLRRITGLFEEQPISESFISLSAENPDGARIPNALEHLKQTIREDRNASVLVLGDYGSGKTSLMYKLAYDLAQEVLSGSQATPTPFYLSLDFARGKPSIVDAFCQFVSRYGIDMSAKFLRDLLNAEPNVVFILDGFDEMANRTDWSEVPAILEKLSQLQVSQGIRLVLTSRTTFFRERLDERQVPATKRLYLSPMDDDQISEYISKNRPEKAEEVKNSLENLPEIRALCKTPIHLVLCVDYLARYDRADESVQPIEIYSSFVEENLLINAPTNPVWPLTERRATVQRLAYQWFKEETFEVGVADVTQVLEKEVPGLGPAEYASRAMQLLNCSFFMRVVDRFRFSHLSFLEYFAAATFVQELYRGNLDAWDERVLYSELFDFMAQMVSKKGIEPLPMDLIVDSDLEVVQTNFLSTMYRRPVGEVWELFDQLLSSRHAIVRCGAGIGIGLDPRKESIASLATAHKKEKNSVMRATFGTLIRGLESTADPACTAPVELEASVPLTHEDAIEVAKAPGAVNGFRRALALGDRRWTSTVASIYVLAAIGDEESVEKIDRIGSQSKLAAVRLAHEDVLPLIAGRLSNARPSHK